MKLSEKNCRLYYSFFLIPYLITSKSSPVVVSSTISTVCYATRFFRIFCETLKGSTQGIKQPSGKMDKDFCITDTLHLESNEKLLKSTPFSEIF